MKRKINMLQPIPDHLQKGLSIIFVGYNPSIRSGETGHHYANPNNRFWNILYQAGLTPHKFKSKEDSNLLNYGYGLTNIVARPTCAAADISKQEYEEGRKLLKQKIAYYRPKIVCFVGKGVYKEYSNKRNITWGAQESSMIPGVIDFVAPSSSGLVRMKINDIVEIYKDLKNHI